MKNIWRFCSTSLLFIIAALVLIFGCADNTAPNKQLTLSINPQQDSIAVGDTTEFKVELEGASNLYGIHLEILFDSTKVEVPSDFLSIGNVWSDHIYLFDCYQFSSKFSVAVVLLEQSNGISGNGELFKFKVIGIKKGISDLRIIENSTLYLIDENGELIEKFDNLIINNTELIIE